MDILRYIESMKNPAERLNPVNMQAYIKPSIMQITLMHTEYVRNGYENPSIFVDINTKDEQWYLIIYIWEEYNFTKSFPFKTLYCSSGYRLPEEEEEVLLYYCTKNNTYINEFMLQEIIKKVNELAPEIHLIYYQDRPLYSILHIYFSFFRGIRELLFKAQLPYLAAAIDQIDSYNMLPVLMNGSPTDLFEKGFTIRLLRLLDNEWGTRELLSEESRMTTVAIYKKFAGNLNTCHELTYSQWEYLKGCYKGKFDYKKGLFQFFSLDKTERLYEDYVIYQAKLRLINKHLNWTRTVSNVLELEKSMEEADYILQYIVEREKWDRLMWEQKYRLMYLDYKDNHFVVTHPNMVKEIFDEGRAQKNCLVTMFKHIARGIIDIGYMRLANKVGESLITFEVMNGEIIHIFGKYNQKPVVDSLEFQWFSNIYIKEKGFQLSDGLKRYYASKLRCHKSINIIENVCDETLE